MSGRLIAIGDIHGYTAALGALVEAIPIGRLDTVIGLGDYVDRGPDSPGTIEMLIALRDRCRLVPILGNHDEMLLQVRGGSPGFSDWLGYGGRETLDAYGCTHPNQIPARHIEFLESCVSYYETARHFFVHASYLSHLPLEEQTEYELRWESLNHRRPGPHYSGKIAIVGHTAQKSGEVLDLGYLKCIDTCCYCGKWLTAMDVSSGRIWQADARGRLRDRDPDSPP
ncbi:MAG: serine/threonine protein phosphatase [Thermoguttaceae bacterium]|jgi:serine/threonine protein phosphatase 1|nr:serine/threonine protein phosphatase [Thermoguttaceae bacterium]